MDNSKPLIIAGRDDGFGERMRALLNALYISKNLVLNSVLYGEILIIFKIY